MKRKQKARLMCKSTDKLLPIATVGQNPWDSAIEKAQGLLVDAEGRALQLRKAIVAFKALRDAGDPWPGTFESASKLLGQK